MPLGAAAAASAAATATSAAPATGAAIGAGVGQAAGMAGDFLTELFFGDRNRDWNASEAEKARQFNSSQADKAWARQMSLQNEMWNRDDNATQRRVADLKAAGINPMLAAGGSAANTQGGSPPQASGMSAAQAHTSQRSGMSQSMMQGVLNRKQLEKIDSEIQLNRDTGAAQLINARANSDRNPSQIASNTSSANQAQAIADSINHDLNKAKLDGSYYNPGLLGRNIRDILSILNANKETVDNVTDAFNNVAGRIEDIPIIGGFLQALLPPNDVNSNLPRVIAPSDYRIKWLDDYLKGKNPPNSDALKQLQREFPSQNAPGMPFSGSSSAQEIERYKNFFQEMWGGNATR